MKNLKISAYVLAATMIFASCSDDDDNTTPPDTGGTNFIGAVYAMTNGNGQEANADDVIPNEQGPNTIVTYGRNADGTLTAIGPVATGGNGGDFDGGEGLDPLISAYAITKTRDNAFVLAVNAGSNTISSLPVNDDFSLGNPTTQATSAEGPNSIDSYPAPESMEGVNSLVLVTNITRSEFLAGGEPMHRGTVDSFWLMDDGSFQSAGASVNLDNRPSCVYISPDGEYAIVASINAGAAGLDVGATDNIGTDATAVGNQDEVVLFSINGGALTRLDGATSTLRGNAEQRNLPSAIGSQIVRGADGELYAVVTEAREFQYDGAPPAFPALQDGSVSTWRIEGDQLVDVDLDVASGTNNTGRTACWLDFNEDESAFFVSNAIEAGLASYSFNNGQIALLDQTAAVGTGTGGADNGPDAFAVTEGWIDMWISDDGQHLYQLYGLDGTIGVYGVNGTSLNLIEEVSDNLPETNTQGIVAI